MITKLLRKLVDQGRLFSYNITPWEYLMLRVRCFFSGHEWRFNSGHPACSRCWKRLS